MGSSKTTRTQSSLESIRDTTAKFKGYDEVVMKGTDANLIVKRECMGLTTKMMLVLNSIAWNCIVEFSIRKLIIIWCPSVEPGNMSTITIEVSYYLGEDVDDLNADETVISLRGKICEGLKATVFPTKSILKRHNEALYVPWKFCARLDDNAGVDENATLGVLKLWCLLDIKWRPRFNRLSSRQYIAPLIEWTNDYHPYYVPFYLIKAVRGVKPLLWRDTTQYKKFIAEVVPHTDIRTITTDNYLTLMQVLSKEDLSSIMNLTASCHQKRGGSCTCGDKMDKFLSSVLLNNNGKCADHGRKYDDICHKVFTGHIKTVSEHLDINY